MPWWCVSRRRRARHRRTRVCARRHRRRPACERRVPPSRLGAAGSRGLPRRAPARRSRGARSERGHAGRRDRRRHVDFTASTVLPVLADGTPLCQVPGFESRPHAYVKLWKHHAAQPHADRINELARSAGEPWLRATAAASPRNGIRQGAAAARRGSRAVRSVPTVGSRPPTGSPGSCAARDAATSAPPATRAIYQDGRYPSEDFLGELDPTSRASSTRSSAPSLAARRPRRRA